MAAAQEQYDEENNVIDDYIIESDVDIEDDTINMDKKINNYEQFTNSILIHENSSYYKQNLCLKKVNKSSIKDPTSKNLEDISNLEGCNIREYKCKCCVLPKDHSGSCEINYNNIFKNKKDPVISRLIGSIDNCIYSTPGNDDYVYKNRASRCFAIALSNKDEKKIRSKDTKKKCAIPLMDSSTPILCAQSYLDWFTFIYNIKDIHNYIKNDNICNNNELNIKNLLNKNKESLIEHYKNIKIFSANNYSICVVTGNEINITDVSDISRDIRINPYNNDIQLGHCLNRSDNYVTIRGNNLVPMSRRGNLIIGQNNILDNKWLEELKKIIEYHNI